jgi:transposase InsO family protein
MPIAPNVLNRQFAVTASNRVCGSDITALWTVEGWVYLAIVVDLFSRKVVGWACAASMATCLVTRALQMAIGQRQPKPGLLHHSDRGSQYASREYQRQLRAAKGMCSMSRKGNCYDNAVVERVFRSLKDEGFTDQPPDTRTQATLSVIDYLGFIIVSGSTRPWAIRVLIRLRHGLRRQTEERPCMDQAAIGP